MPDQASLGSHLFSHLYNCWSLVATIVAEFYFTTRTWSLQIAAVATTATESTIRADTGVAVGTTRRGSAYLLVDIQGGALAAKGGALAAKGGALVAVRSSSTSILLGWEESRDTDIAAAIGAAAVPAC